MTGVILTLQNNKSFSLFCCGSVVGEVDVLYKWGTENKANEATDDAETAEPDVRDDKAKTATVVDGDDIQHGSQHDERVGQGYHVRRRGN